MNKFAAISIVIVLLLAGNVYQFYNPKVIEVPSGQQEIDIGAWVQRAAYVHRGALLDSLRRQNEVLAKTIQDSRDEIANMTVITGRLNTEIDSLNMQLDSRPIDLAGLLCSQEPFSAQRLDFERSFGNNLFNVLSTITIERESVSNDIQLHQLRDIELSVTNTISTDRSRMLTYVTSDDFVQLDYQTYTELDYKKRKPMFLYGVAAGILVTVILN